MSFLDNVKAKTGTGVNNPFATVGGAKTAASKPGANPFAPKTAKPAVPMAPVGVPTPPKAGMPTPPKAGVPAPVNMPRPGVPSPGMPKANPLGETKITAPTPVEVEEPKIISTEELVKDMSETSIEVPAEKPKEDIAKASSIEEDNKPKATAKSKSRSSASKKKTEQSAAKEIVDAPISKEESEKIENIFRMPTTNMRYSDAIKAIKSGFIDKQWEDFRSSMIEESDSIVIESDMQEGAIKKTIAQLATLRDKVWVQFCDTKVIIENLSSKDTEGLIETVKFASLEGSNDITRKKAAVLAVMNYKTPEGDLVNLYEVYYETKGRFNFLKSLIDTIDYKSRVLITMSGAVKIQKGM